MADLAASLDIPAGVVPGLLAGTTLPAAKTYIKALEVVATDECGHAPHGSGDHPLDADEEAALRAGRDLLGRR